MKTTLKSPTPRAKAGAVGPTTNRKTSGSVMQAAAKPQASTSARTVPGAKGKKMAAPQTSDVMVGILRDTIVSLVRRDGADLSARQLGVFLTCYLQEGSHTVRGLAAELNVSKPAITRALDRLGELDLARRKVDPMDRRSVLVQRTIKGAAFLRDLRSIMNEASAATSPGRKSEGRAEGRRAAS
jgi:DNA-binding MarR family transcriptional regulator